MRSFGYLGFACLLLSACASLPVASDPKPAIGKDSTLVLSGCGVGPTSGYLVCRVIEEASTESTQVTLHVPKVECDGEACAYYKILGPGGQVLVGGSIPKGEETAYICFAKLLKSKAFSAQDRGLFAVSLELKWRQPDDPKSFERTAYAEGWVFLRVLPKGYESLNQFEDHPLFVWKQNFKGDRISYTTGMRSSVHPLPIPNPSNGAQGARPSNP